MKNESTDQHKKVAEIIRNRIEKTMEGRGMRATVSCNALDKLLALYFPEPMTEQRAREILGDWLDEDEDIQSSRDGIFWRKDRPNEVKIDSYLTPEQLDAIAFWIKFKGSK